MTCPAGHGASVYIDAEPVFPEIESFQMFRLTLDCFVRDLGEADQLCPAFGSPQDTNFMIPQLLTRSETVQKVEVLGAWDNKRGVVMQ
jgi:hypothetical protein